MKLTHADMINFDPLSWMHVAYTGEDIVCEDGTIRGIFNRAINQKYGLLPVESHHVREGWGRFASENWALLRAASRCSAAYRYQAGLCRSGQYICIGEEERGFINSGIRHPRCDRVDGSRNATYAALTRAEGLSLSGFLPEALAKRLPFLYEPEDAGPQVVCTPDVLLFRLAIQYVRNNQKYARK